MENGQAFNHRIDPKGTPGIYYGKFFLSRSVLTEYREKYIEKFLTKQIGKLIELEKTILNSMNENATLTDKIVEMRIN